MRGRPASFLCWRLPELFSTKGGFYAAVTTRSLRRTFRGHRTQHGLRAGSRPGGCTHLDGSGPAQPIRLFARPWHVRGPTVLPIRGRCRRRGPSHSNGLEGGRCATRKRVMILPTYEQGTWADQVVVPARNIVPMSEEADPLQLSMIGINPATAYLLLNRYVDLMAGDWIGQTAANSAMGQYTVALAKRAGVKTLNVVRREEAAEEVRQWGGDLVVLQGDDLHKDVEEALDGKKLSARPRYGGRDSRGGVGQVAQERWLDRRLRPSERAVSGLLARLPLSCPEPPRILARQLATHRAPRGDRRDLPEAGPARCRWIALRRRRAVYALDQFKEAFERSLKSNRSGKILFEFGAD